MKQVLFAIAILHGCIVSLAQQHKPTGGCGYKCTLENVTPYFVNNGHTYAADIALETTLCETPWGNCTLTLDSQVVLEMPDIFYDFRTTVYFDVAGITEGVHHLVFTFHSNDCGNWHAEKDIAIVRDTTVPATLPPADTTKPATLPYTGKCQLLAGPNPVNGVFTIDGLRPTETSYQLVIRNMAGEKVEIPEPARTESALKISLKDLANGLYIAELQTNERAWKQRIQVLQ